MREVLITSQDLDLKEFITKIDALAGIVGGITRDPEGDTLHHALRKLVTSANKIVNDHKSEAISKRMLRTGHLKPSTVESLLDRLQKLSRYCSSSNTLSDLAKRHPFIMDATVDEVHLNGINFEPFEWSGTEPELHAVLKMYIMEDQVDSILGRPTSETNQSTRFYESLPGVFRTWTIHAEIQLLFHYEINCIRVRPRFVCANKDACYLCHSFLRAFNSCHPDNMMVSPKTHGKLYSQWGLPTLSGIPPVLKELNKILGLEIITEISERLHPGRRIQNARNRREST